MKTVSKVQLNMWIPENYRNLLRRMAAERMMENPGEAVTGTSIATKILLDALKELVGETEREGGALK